MNPEMITRPIDQPHRTRIRSQRRQRIHVLNRIDHRRTGLHRQPTIQHSLSSTITQRQSMKPLIERSTTIRQTIHQHRRNPIHLRQRLRRLSRTTGSHQPRHTPGRHTRRRNRNKTTQTQPTQ